MSPLGSAVRLANNFPGTLFDKMGGDDGIKIFIDKVFEKVAEDHLLCTFYYSRPGVDIGMIKDKYRFYFTHLTGGATNWIGRPIEQAHRNVQIDDKVFDLFNSHCIQTLKEMRRLKVDGLKEMIRLL